MTKTKTKTTPEQVLEEMGNWAMAMGAPVKPTFSASYLSKVLGRRRFSQLDSESTGRQAWGTSSGGRRGGNEDSRGRNNRRQVTGAGRRGFGNSDLWEEDSWDEGGRESRSGRDSFRAPKANPWSGRGSQKGRNRR